MKLTNSSLLKQSCYIAGQWINADDSTMPVFNPSTREIIASVPKLGKKETLSAIAAAEQAQKTWKKKTAKERSAIMHNWRRLIIKNIDDLSVILTTEQGKPLDEARGEIIYAASFIEWFAEEAKRIYGETIPSHKPNSRIIVTKEPVGVVGAITPWNFPAAMLTRKCGPAFAAGCAVVLKPAPETPLTALALAGLAELSGVPAGLFNVVTGNAAEIGEALTNSKNVRKISFTGSTTIGKLLMERSASSVKKMSLELGGNAPLIVFEDADLELAIEGVMIAKFRNAGQTCVCANRLYIHDAVYEKFTKMLVARVSKMKVADGFKDGAQIGPLIDKAAVAKVQSYVDDALTKGANRIFGVEPLSGTNFFPPQVLTEMTDEMKIAHEEVFGPIAALFRFKSDDEVISFANNTKSGLAAYVYTQSLQRAWRISEELEVGMVGINEGLISTEIAPFGGVKESGLGREGARQGIEEYLETKYTLMGGFK